VGSPCPDPALGAPGGSKARDRYLLLREHALMRSYSQSSQCESSSERPEAWASRMSRPEHEVPHPVPIAVLLARTDDVAVAVAGVSAYTTGITFELVIRMRVRPPGIGGHELPELIHGWGNESDSRQLLFGVEYPDGRKISNVGGPAWPRSGIPDDQPVLLPGGGGGSDLAQEMSYWLSPVPPDGPVAFVCAWLAVGIEETRRVIEDAALTSASAQAVVLWPPQPLNDPTPAKPTLPANGLFAALREGSAD
jgi:hypothetical protein